MVEPSEPKSVTKKVENLRTQPKKKKQDKKHDEKLEAYLDRMSLKEEEAAIKEKEMEEHIKEVKAEKKARKLEKKKKAMMCLSAEQFEDHLKTLNSKFKAEHYLDWDKSEK